MPIINKMLNFVNCVKINMSRGPETDIGTDIQGHIRPLFSKIILALLFMNLFDENLYEC